MIAEGQSPSSRSPRSLGWSTPSATTASAYLGRVRVRVRGKGWSRGRGKGWGRGRGRVGVGVGVGVRVRVRVRVSGVLGGGGGVEAALRRQPAAEPLDLGGRGLGGLRGLGGGRGLGRRLLVVLVLVVVSTAPARTPACWQREAV